ncbi:MAG: tryptophan 7-halogenase [Calothrix sp. MO_167.B12]|nr:tryptophan 7-halogenase [Calothrix sp. MO_167.B12]
MNNNLPPEIDVVIIGGGPAGVATALALKNQGQKSVAILEKTRQDNFRIGETLPPSVPPILKQLGVYDVLTENEHLRSWGNSSAWGGSQLGFQDFFFYPGGQGWHLNRSQFDASLTRAAQKRGVMVMWETTALGCNQLADGQWRLKLRAKDGSQFHIKTSFVVDATGHRSLFATWQGASKVRMDRLIAVASVFTWDKNALEDYYTLVETTELGWWYAARLPHGQAIATFMSDSNLLQKYGLLQAKNWTTYLQQTRHIQKLTHNASKQSRLLIQPATSQYLDQMSGDGWLAVGDAACTLDPLASAGIYKALQSGIKAGEAIALYFAGNGNALTTYELETRHQFEVYLQDRIKYYAQEKRWNKSPFWRSRRGRVSLSPAQPIFFPEFPQIPSALRRLNMYLPPQDLQLLCQLCNSSKNASHVVAQFLAQSGGQISAYRVIEALQGLLERKILTSH